MAGYFKNEKATAETIRNGWLHTGDMGYVDNDGFLYVVGRFKSLLISSDGENTVRKELKNPCPTILILSIRWCCTITRIRLQRRLLYPIKKP